MVGFDNAEQGDLCQWPGRNSARGGGRVTQRIGNHHVVVRSRMMMQVAPLVELEAPGLAVVMVRRLPFCVMCCWWGECVQRIENVGKKRLGADCAC